MKISLMTMGTRGDVQPYAVLGRELQRGGHEVTLSSARNFEGLANSYGLPFVPVDADYQALLDSDEGKQMIKNPLLAQRNFARRVHPMIYNSLQTFYDLSVKSDRVIFQGKTLAGYFADQFPQKMVRANVVPAFDATAEFVNPVLSGWKPPAFLNRLTYKLTEWSLKMMHKPISQFREANGLSPKIADHAGLLSLYGISNYVLPMPSDYPPDTHFTGFWHSDSPAELSEDIVRFVDAGSTPLLITFGSMPLPAQIDVQAIILNLVKRLSIRVIIVKGWGFEQTHRLEQEKDIKIIDSAPYEKLFPLVKAVAHHGGIGTTAECMRAGKPFLVCPILYPTGDQYFWGDLACKNGYGIKPIPLKKLDENRFIEAIGKLMTTESLYQNAGKLADKLKMENGLDNAIRLIEERK